MRLIVETDIGHDPDDFFAITYLLAAGVQIDAILVTPGDPDQIAIAELIRDECSPKTLIGQNLLGPLERKLSSGSIHHDLLKRYTRSFYGKADEFGENAITLKRRFTPCHVMETELFVIGPVSNVGHYLRKGGAPFARATMQGGFVPYSLYRPEITLEKFEGKQSMPTFNLNGDRDGAAHFLSANMPRQMVGKNVCHTIEFTRERFATFEPPKNRAAELFHEAATLYFERHEAKKFHDPTAAVCHLHPEIGLWMDGKTVKHKDGWTTVPGEDQVLVDIDRDALWERLRTLS